MKFKIKKIDYGNGDIHYVILKRNWLGLYVKFFYKINGYHIYEWNDVCMKQFNRKILHLTQMAFDECIILKHLLGYSVLDYFTDIDAAKHFIRLVIKYNKKRKKITYEKYP